jgi:hypothetical protein
MKEQQQAHLIEKLLTSEDSFYHEGKPQVSKRVRKGATDKYSKFETFGAAGDSKSPKLLSPHRYQK